MGGVERRRNADMGLMDLDGALKQYSYKIVTHGNIKVACVDWEKTTAEARKPKASLEAGKSNASPAQINFVGQRDQFDGVEYFCANNPEKLRELKAKELEIRGKMGENSTVLGPIQTRKEKRGTVGKVLVRRECTGEESLWMEKGDYKGFMIDRVVALKEHLTGYGSKSDDAVQ